MRSYPFLSFSLLTICFFLLFAASSIKAQCGPNTVGVGDVGIVANNPFHAEVTHTSTGHADMKAILRPNFPEWVARDARDASAPKESPENSSLTLVRMLEAKSRHT